MDLNTISPRKLSASRRQGPGPAAEGRWPLQYYFSQEAIGTTKAGSGARRWPQQRGEGEEGRRRWEQKERGKKTNNHSQRFGKKNTSKRSPLFQITTSKTSPPFQNNEKCITKVFVINFTKIAKWKFTAKIFVANLTKIVMWKLTTNNYHKALCDKFDKNCRMKIYHKDLCGKFDKKLSCTNLPLKFPF